MSISKFDLVTPTNVAATVAAFFNGAIDLDPASSEAANNIVQAERYFTPDNDGLRQSWKAKTLYLYPPRGSLLTQEHELYKLLFEKQTKFRKSAQRIWLETAINKYRKGEYEEAIVFLTSSEVALIVTQKLGIDLPMCVMNARPKLILDNAQLQPLKSVRSYGFLFYIPASQNMEKRIMAFQEQFSDLGRVYI